MVHHRSSLCYLYKRLAYSSLKGLLGRQPVSGGMFRDERPRQQLQCPSLYTLFRNKS